MFDEDEFHIKVYPVKTFIMKIYLFIIIIVCLVSLIGFRINVIENQLKDGKKKKRVKKVKGRSVKIWKRRNN